MMSKKSILLTGASGTVGSEILKQLVDQDKYDITVFDKRSEKSQKIFSPYLKKISIVYGDLTNLHEVEKVCIDKDVAIHVGAMIPPAADDHPQMAERVNVEGTQNLIKAFELHSPKAFLLYSSSISVYGDRIKNPYIQVGDPLNPSIGDHYAETKIAAETLIQKSSLKWSIFRLTAIMGNHKISKLMFHMPLNTPLEICTPEDTARAFVHAIEQEDALNGQIFNLGGGKACRTTYAEFLKRSFSIMGLGKFYFPPYSFATQNFHCGYYVDGDELENILRFRQDSLDDYFNQVQNSVPVVQRFFTSLLQKPIKWYLRKESEPLEAYKKQDEELMERFFGRGGNSK